MRKLAHSCAPSGEKQPWSSGRGGQQSGPYRGDVGGTRAGKKKKKVRGRGRSGRGRPEVREEKRVSKNKKEVVKKREVPEKEGGGSRNR